MSYRIASYKSNTIRYFLLFSVSGTIIYFFILEPSEKALINYWKNNFLDNVTYVFELFYAYIQHYLG